jgi:hypothetical protein
MIKAENCNNRVIKIVEQYIASGKTTSKELMALWSISKTTYYKRIHAESPFLFTEVMDFANKFGLSLDTFSAIASNQKIFTFKKFSVQENPEATFTHYINNLLQDLAAVKASGLQQIYYAAKDLPLFCFFSSPLLTAFKLYFWNMTIFHTTDKPKVFTTNWLPADILEKAKIIFDSYQATNTIEIWNLETINSTLHQIEYCLRSNLLTKELAVEIISKLKEFIDQQYATCSNGNKPQGGKLSMYFNEILLLDNSVIFDLGIAKIFYMPYQTLNFLSNTDVDFTDYSIDWFTKQQAKSHYISNSGEEQRNKLFAFYTKQIEEVLNRL